MQSRQAKIDISDPQTTRVSNLLQLVLIEDPEAAYCMFKVHAVFNG